LWLYPLFLTHLARLLVELKNQPAADIFQISGLSQRDSTAKIRAMTGVQLLE
jgi:hypothetical protein